MLVKQIIGAKSLRGVHRVPDDRSRTNKVGNGEERGTALCDLSGRRMKRVR